MAAEMAGSGWWQIAESSGGGRQLLRRAVAAGEKRRGCRQQRMMTGSGEAGGEERKRKQRAIAANSGGDGKRVRTRLSPKKRLAAPPQPVPFDQETHRLFPDRFRGTAATTAPRKLLPEPASPRKRSPPSRRSLFPPTKKHTACSRAVSGERQQPPPRRASVRTRPLPKREARRPAAAPTIRPGSTPQSPSQCVEAIIFLAVR